MESSLRSSSRLGFFRIEGLFQRDRGTSLRQRSRNRRPLRQRWCRSWWLRPLFAHVSSLSTNWPSSLALRLVLTFASVFLFVSFALRFKRTFEEGVKSFQVNTWGAIFVAQVFLPLLRLGEQKKIVYTSSALGSTGLAL